MPSGAIRLLPPLAGLALALLTLQLGNWQLGRAHEKGALQARLDAAAAAPPLADAVPTDPPDGRHVRLHGQWLRDATIYLDNRVRAGRAGYHVLTPLRLADGTAVLVDRGWIAAASVRAQLPEVPTPADGQVGGTVRRPQPAPFMLGGAVAQGRVWQSLDLAQYRQRSGVAVRDWIVRQTSVADDGLVREWPRPDAGIERHRGYALQWYALAALSLGLTLAHLFRRFVR